MANAITHNAKHNPKIKEYFIFFHNVGFVGFYSFYIEVTVVYF